jgi:glycosyltransferase involved in cell wall biosynthesis
VANSGKNPAVSIITPAYNAGRYLGVAIASVLSQTVPDLEMIIVDDGSTDDTSSIAGSFARHDRRVRVVRQANAGTAAARNTAIAAARGRFYALLDADDWWMPDFLRVQLGILIANPAIDILSVNAINAGGRWNGTPWHPVSSAALQIISLRHLIEVEDSVCIMSVFRRRVVDRIGGFDQSMHRNEDYDFWVRAAIAGCSIAFNPKPLGYYRRHAASKSANEEAAVAGILDVYRSARRGCAGRPAELAAIDRQIARFERERQLAGVRSAVLRRDFDRAGHELEDVVAAGAAIRYRVAAFLMRFMPGLVHRAYLTKLAVRDLTLRRRAAA